MLMTLPPTARLEDAEGVAVAEQELRRVNLGGGTTATLEDQQTLQTAGCVRTTLSDSSKDVH